MTKISPTHVDSDESYWRYKGWPAHDPAPRGVKVQLLTPGHIAVTGFWSDDMLA